MRNLKSFTNILFLSLCIISFVIFSLPIYSELPLRYWRWFLIAPAILFLGKYLTNRLYKYWKKSAIAASLCLPFLFFHYNHEIILSDPFRDLVSYNFSWYYLLQRVLFVVSFISILTGLGSIPAKLFFKTSLLKTPDIISVLFGFTLCYFTAYTFLLFKIQLYYLQPLFWIGAIIFFLKSLARFLTNEILESDQLQKRTSFDNQEVLLLITLITMGCTFFLGKIANPFHRDGDVWLHYLPYYLEVAKSNSFGPNELWYHFFCSKGSIWQFVILKTTNYDITSINIFSFFYFIVAAYWVLINERHSKNFKIWLGAFCIFIGLFSNTSILGNFGKNHEYIFANMLILFGILKNKTYLIDIGAKVPLFVLFVVQTVLLAPVTGPVLTLTFISVAYLFSKDKGLRLLFVGSGVGSFIAFLFQLIFNYIYTGLALETPLKTMFALGNQLKMAKFFDPYLVFYLNSGTSSSIGSINLLNFANSFKEITEISKVGLLYKTYGIMPLIAILILLIYNRKFIVTHIKGSEFQETYKNNLNNIAILFFLILTVCFIGLGAITGQYVSLNRMTSFVCLEISLLTSIAIFWFLREANFKGKSMEGLFALVILSLCIHQTTQCSGFNQSISMVAEWLNGEKNSYDLLKNITPEAKSWERVKSKLRQEDKMLCLNIISGPENITQNQVVYSEVSYCLGTKWSDLAFGDAKKVIANLDRNKITHIALVKNNGLFGALPFRNDIDIILLKHFQTHFEDKNIIVWMRKNNLKSKKSSSKSLSSVYSFIDPRFLEWNKKMSALYIFCKKNYENHSGKIPVMPERTSNQMGWQ